MEIIRQSIIDQVMQINDETILRLIQAYTAAVTCSQDNSSGNC